MSSSPVPHSRILPFVLLLLIGVAWGTMFSLIKIAVTGGITPLAYLFWFTLGSGILLLIIGAIRRKRPPLTRAHIRFYVMTAMCRLVLANTILYTVQKKIPVGVMAVIMATVPIFTYAMSVAAGIERYMLLRFLGIMCSFTGVVLIIGPRGSLPDPSLTWWVLFGLAAPFLHALSYILLSEDRRPKGSDSVTLAAGILCTASLLVLPVALAVGDLHLLWPPFSNAELALIVHMVLAAFNFYIIFELIRIAGATFMTQANFLSVGFGVMFGMLIFGETHSVWVWAAIGLTVAGLALVNMRQDAARS